MGGQNYSSSLQYRKSKAVLLFTIIAGGAGATWRSSGKQLQYEISESGMNPATLQRYVHQGSLTTNQHSQGF